MINGFWYVGRVENGVFIEMAGPVLINEQIDQWLNGSLDLGQFRESGDAP